MSRTKEKRVESKSTQRREVRPVNPYFDALLRQTRIAANQGRGSEAPLAIGVTSCRPQDGVTTIALNLSIAAATCANSAILLVDASGEKSCLHERLKLSNADSGLLNVLAGQSEPFACTQTTMVENLSLMPCGRLDGGLKPAYDPGTVEEVIDHLKHVFPLAIFDLPPANELTPCFALAAKMDGVLLVVEAGRTDAPTLSRVKQQFEAAGAKVLGVVVNKCDQ